jgi:hypothetical protein
VTTKFIDLPNTDSAVTLSFPLPDLTTHYVRVVAEPYGQTPAGNNAWLYVDEVIVE